MVINWRGKKVLIAGGAGMIGSHMALELLNRGATVTIADNLSSGSINNLKPCEDRAEFIECDLRDETTAMKVCRGKDAVFQFAADMGGIGYITAIGADIMVNNTRINVNMLRASADVEHYYFSSSACVYPNYLQASENEKSINLKESDAIPADPNEFYGWEKLYCEKMVEAAQRDWGRNIHVGRFHNVYGAVYTAFDKDKGKAPCHLIMKALRHPDPPMVLWGDGKAVRSYLYIDDCIAAVLRLMNTDYKKPINIGSDRCVSVDELASIIIKISGKNIVPEHDISKPQGVRGRNSDNALASKVLGTKQMNWEPVIPLEEGLAHVYQWAEENFDKLEGI